MSNVDDTIREALRREEGEGFEFTREQSLLQEAIDVFRSRRRWTAAVSVAISLGVMAVAAYMAVRFFDAAEVKEMIAWSIGFLLCIIVMSMMKLWFWMEMERNAILREVKRLEAQVARLAERSSGR